MEHKKYISYSLDRIILQRKAVLGFFAKSEAPGEVVGCVSRDYKRPLTSSQREDRSKKWSDSPSKNQELKAESTAWIADINPRS